jgi:GTP-binding protein
MNSPKYKITSTKFVTGIVDDHAILSDGVPQIAFVGRSNVGKSSLINTLTGSSVSRTSSFPGRTQEINIFLVNKEFYFVDLPGYGFARADGAGREKISELIDSYLFSSVNGQKKVVMIVDLNVGMTEKDMLMLSELEKHQKDFIIVANKTDRATQSELYHKLNEIKKNAGGHMVIPFSSKKRTGLDALLEEILK